VKFGYRRAISLLLKLWASFSSKQAWVVVTSFNVGTDGHPRVKQHSAIQ